MKTSASERLETALARIADPAGEGARACLTVYANAARAEAAAADARTRSGVTLGPLDGALVTVKDLFDVAGEPTRAGSVTRVAAAPATEDAPVVRRLRAAGAVILAKTNMTEFAFSGVGLNPHFGTPGNPFDRRRIPGGSSSGAAVAVADGLCEIAIGSDTGGSTRIPAALCGVVGFKPSRQRVPTAGAFPLSYTLDSIGPLARTVAECALADAVMAAEDPVAPDPAPLGGLRIGIARGLPFEHMDATVGAAFAEALTRLGRAGAHVADMPLPFLDEMTAANERGAIAPAEAFAIHRRVLETRGAEVDPNVRARIERGGGIAAADYVETMQARQGLIRAMDTHLADLDVVVLPTVPIVAPRMSAVATRESFATVNMLLLRNTSIANFFDLCAISLPLPRSGGLPAGLMLFARNGADRRLLRIAAAMERLFAQ